MTERGDGRKDTPQNTISVLLVDDHPIVRGGMRKLLEMEPDIRILAEVGTGESAIEAVRRLDPDVVLLDINLPSINGLQVTAHLKAESYRAAVVLLTAYDDETQEIHALRAGAAAYCPKAIEPDRLLGVIRAAAKGKYMIGGEVCTESGVQLWLDARMRGLARTADDEGRTNSLSPREMEILQRVARGLSNKAIAYELGISHQTVRNHMTSIIHKLNVRGRTDAAIYALKHGWVSAREYHPPLEE